MHTYTIEAVDAQGNPVRVSFPAVTLLMAKAWAELCHDSNGWERTTLSDEEGRAIEEWL